MLQIHALFILAILVSVLSGCVLAEQREATAAREAFQRCIEEHPDSSSSCDVLRERSLQAQRRYEESSRRAWGCDPSQLECPTPR